MRVLCMSGYTDDVAVRGQVLRTDLAFVQKPFTPALLTSRVREVLDGDVPFRRVPWSDVAGSESGLSALAPTD